MTPEVLNEFITLIAMARFVWSPILFVIHDMISVSEVNTRILRIIIPIYKYF